MSRNERRIPRHKTRCVQKKSMNKRRERCRVTVTTRRSDKTTRPPGSRRSSDSIEIDRKLHTRPRRYRSGTHDDCDYDVVDAVLNVFNNMGGHAQNAEAVSLESDVEFRRVF